MGWIKTTKEKNRDRDIELEDRKYVEEHSESAFKEEIS